MSYSALILAKQSAIKLKQNIKLRREQRILKAKMLWNGVLIRIRIKKIVHKYGNTIDQRMRNRVIHSFKAQNKFLRDISLQRAKEIVYQALFDKAKKN